MPARRAIAVELSRGGRALIAVDRRRQRHRAGPAGAGGRAPRHLEARRRRADPDHPRSAFAARRWPRSPASAGCASSAGRVARSTPSRSSVEAGVAAPPAPAAGAFGTRVEVRDLFFATPARLKFLKSDRAEQLAAREALERLAMAYPGIAFTLHADGRRVLALDARGGRSVRADPRAPAPAHGPRVRRRCAGARGRARRRAPVGSDRPARLPATTRRAFSICSSTAGRCRTACSRAPCAPPMAICCRATASRWPRCSCSWHPRTSTSTSIRPRRRCAFARRHWCAACVIGAIRQRLAAAGCRPSSALSAAALGAFRPGGGPPGAALPGGLAESRGRVSGAARRRSGSNSGRRPPAATGGAIDDVGARALSARRRAHPAARQLHRGADRERPGPGRPARRARTPGLRAHEGGARCRRGAAPGPAAARGGRARPGGGRARAAGGVDELDALGLVLEPFGEGAVLVRELPALLGSPDVPELIRELGRGPRRDRSGAQPAGGARARVRDARLPRQRAGRAPAHAGRDERAAAPDGGDPEQRPMQSRPAHIRDPVAGRHRTAVRAPLRCAEGPRDRPGSPGQAAAAGPHKVQRRSSAPHARPEPFLDLRRDRSLHQMQVHGLRRGLPGGLLLRRREHAGDQSRTNASTAAYASRSARSRRSCPTPRKKRRSGSS